MRVHPPHARLSGFTLVELMVVVSIIGLLSAIAIPNFIKFQARSKQSEAKTNLRAIYTGQTSYYSEFERYSNALGDISFAPERGNRYAYDLGTTTGTPKNDGSFACPTPEGRTAAVITASAGVSCATQADVYRYLGTIVPTNFVGRTSMVFMITSTGVPALPPDTVGTNFVSCPTCNFAARAWGNVDNDLGADEFFIASQYTTAAAAPCAEGFVGLPPGTPLQARNDVACE